MKLDHVKNNLLEEIQALQQQKATLIKEKDVENGLLVDVRRAKTIEENHLNELKEQSYNETLRLELLQDQARQEQTRVTEQKKLLTNDILSLEKRKEELLKEYNKIKQDKPIDYQKQNEKVEIELWQALNELSGTLYHLEQLRAERDQLTTQNKAKNEEYKAKTNEIMRKQDELSKRQSKIDNFLSLRKKNG